MAVNRILSIPIALSLLALAACNTPPQRPYTPPQTQSRTPPPPPPPAAMQSRREQAQPSPAAPSGPQTTTQTPTPAERSPATPLRTDSEPPATNAAADVEITDIPVDEDGNPIISPPPSGGGGGGPTPRYGQSDADSGGSGGGAPRIDGAEAGPVINIGAETDAERGAALEQDLATRLAKFDELMRRARTQADQERAAAGGGGAGGRYAGIEDGRGARQNPPPAGRGAGGQADTSSGLGHTPDASGSYRAGEFKYTAAGAVPNDIPNARDDDIVARQLREAATRETDPVLREKLWDEYRKYRKGIGRR